MKILILGGTGAMGVELVNILHNCELELFITSRKAHSITLPNVHYIVGNARDNMFLQEVLKIRYDVIVDFMSYSTNEFQDRAIFLLNSTDQYMYLSSARVYIDSSDAITESTARILDMCSDETYLATDEYALAKARQEDILKSLDHNNWTIVRPYITYNSERLQLGMFEKEFWLFRALRGKNIVFSKDIACHLTTLTYANDVAIAISRLIGNKQSLGNVYQIVSPFFMTWEAVLDIYLNTIEEVTGQRPKVIFETDSHRQTDILGNKYQVVYDRLYNRKFDSTKLNLLCNMDGLYVSIEEGLKNCLKSFIENEQYFRDISWKWEGYADRITGEKTDLKEIFGIKKKFTYLIWRYFPVLGALKEKFCKF